ncbi:MAG TPA: polysaccharide pyruvyl transferase CsaB [Armatimonadota bacterium]|nr:polysaccharide pyruvyl transferase CsaB [Armatimonadota bacterium]
MNADDQTSPAASQPHVTMSGYYGFANTGDDAILEATIGGITQFAPHAQFTVLADSTGDTKNINYLPRYEPRSVWRALKPPGLFLSGGGGLFQDVTSRRSLFYYLGILWLAKARGMKTMVYAQGLGPLKRQSSQTAVRFVLRRADAITLRDTASEALLADIGLSNLAFITADPAFTLEPATSERVDEIFSDEAVPTAGRRIGVALRPWTGLDEKRETAIVEALRLAAYHLQAHLVFIGMHSPRDQTLSDRIAARVDRAGTVIRGVYRPSEVAGILGRCDAVIAMRLHALILAAISGTPAAAISYDPKVPAAAIQLGLPCLDVDDLDAHGLFTVVQELVASGATERERIRSAARIQRDRAGENFEIIRRLLSP